MVFTHLNWKPINQKCGHIDCNAMAYHMCDYKMFDGRIFSGCKRPMCLDHAVVAISKTNPDKYYKYMGYHCVDCKRLFELSREFYALVVHIIILTIVILVFC